ncbi:hypothetical protein C9374_009402 [Naegleria lovaniensis]|uniref:Uncharacterized protein n=1 Tax=Naegleria lovaniensis TaxID=51637 RepID=A0AA88GHX8_NAELO|nr:uncharacterized protein C9374_009402 [Naegleria lovaniensis]KAG2377491.1 hypothetical protein C9374_009402 [Naegleria lovaniensis]
MQQRTIPNTKPQQHQHATMRKTSATSRELEKKYNTESLIESMLSESKLTHFQKKEVLSSLKNKSSLPSSGIALSKKHEMDDSLRAYRLKNQPASVDLFPDSNKGKFTTKKKLFDQSLFQREVFRPSATVDREREKNLLATYNEFGGKQSTPSVIIKGRIDKQVVTPPKQTQPQKSRMEEIEEEINDRLLFIEEMEQNGAMNREQKQIILAQIDEYVREMNAICSK